MGSGLPVDYGPQSDIRGSVPACTVTLEFNVAVVAITGAGHSRVTAKTQWLAAGVMGDSGNLPAVENAFGNTAATEVLRPHGRKLVNVGEIQQIRSIPGQQPIVAMGVEGIHRALEARRISQRLRPGVGS